MKKESPVDKLRQVFEDNNLFYHIIESCENFEAPIVYDIELYRGRNKISLKLETGNYEEFIKKSEKIAETSVKYFNEIERVMNEK